MDNPNNRMVAAGRLENAPMLSHEVMHEPFYAGTLLVKRLSGAVDKIPVTIPGKLLPPEGDPAGKLMLFQGQVRSYNKVVDGAGRLMVTLFVQSMCETSENETLNKVSLTGALCKPPIYRTTPFGREIADILLAVNRAFRKSDYIPCIAWGRLARYAQNLSMGDMISISGRMQSRIYEKTLPDGSVMEKTAYEVSIGSLEKNQEVTV